MRKKQRRGSLPNKSIVIAKIICACFLLLVVGLFLLMETRIQSGTFIDTNDVERPRMIVVHVIQVLWREDITQWNLLPIAFFLAVIAVMAYISFLVFAATHKSFQLSDRYDVMYKVVFSFVLLYICIRSLFIEPFLQVPLEIVVIAVVSGIFNWIIPPIVCNDSEEF